MSLNSAAFSNLVDLTHVVIYDGFGFYEGGSKFKVRPIDDVTDVPRGTRLRSPDSRARKSHFASHSSGHCGNSQVALYSRVEEGVDPEKLNAVCLQLDHDLSSLQRVTGRDRFAAYHFLCHSEDRTREEAYRREILTGRNVDIWYARSPYAKPPGKRSPRTGHDQTTSERPASAKNRKTSSPVSGDREMNQLVHQAAKVGRGEVATGATPAPSTSASDEGHAKEQSGHGEDIIGPTGLDGNRGGPSASTTVKGVAATTGTRAEVADDDVVNCASLPVGRIRPILNSSGRLNLGRRQGISEDDDSDIVPSSNIGEDEDNHDDEDDGDQESLGDDDRDEEYVPNDDSESSSSDVSETKVARLEHRIKRYVDSRLSSLGDSVSQRTRIDKSKQTRAARRPRSGLARSLGKRFAADMLILGCPLSTFASLRNVFKDISKKAAFLDLMKGCSVDPRLFCDELLKRVCEEQLHLRLFVQKSDKWTCTNGRAIIFGEEYHELPKEIQEAIWNHMVLACRPPLTQDRAKRRLNTHLQGRRAERKRQMKRWLLEKINEVDSHPLYEALYYDTECAFNVFDAHAPLGPAYTDADRTVYFNKYKDEYSRMVRRHGRGAYMPHLPASYNGRPAKAPQHSKVEPRYPPRGNVLDV